MRRPWGTAAMGGRRDGRAVRQARLFVAALGASNYLSGEASWTQALPDWVGSHCRALASFGIKVVDSIPTARAL